VQHSEDPEEDIEEAQIVDEELTEAIDTPTIETPED
jgi:hypothetical protein